MMKNKSFRERLTLFAAIVFAAAVGVTACAVVDEPTVDDFELESIDAWVAKYYPDMEEIETGLYMKFYKQTDADPLEYDGEEYVEVNFSAKTLEGNYFYNTYPDLADTLGTFSFYNNYVPVRSAVDYASTNLSSAIGYALININEGDSVDIVTRSSYYYGSDLTGTVPSGYGGNITVGYNVPALIRMKLYNVIEDIYTYERDQIFEYAQDKMGLAVADSVEDLSLLYFKVIDANPSESDTLPYDTTVNVNYVGRFIDGFVFDTNIEDTAIEHRIYSTSGTYDEYSVWLDDSDEGSIDGFREAVSLMRIGETAIAIFSSQLGYGTGGSESGSTVIPPYTPLVFELTVVEDED